MKENIHPNNLSTMTDLSQQNLVTVNENNQKKSVFKQSYPKINFDRHQYPFLNQSSRSIKAQSKFIHPSKEITRICEWVSAKDQFKSITYLPMSEATRLMHTLHQKVQNLIIVISEYHTYWMPEMEEITRLTKLRWGFLNLHQRKDEKVKMLELYETRKLKLFFISPSLFNYEDFHEFTCDLLMIMDLHLYKKSSGLLQKIIQKCSPNKLLGLYSTPLVESTLNHMKLDHINRSTENMKTYLCLKTTKQQKLKMILSYLEKNEVKKALVLVNGKSQAKQLGKALKLKALTSFNLFQSLTNQEIYSFTSKEILFGNKNEEKVLSTINKAQNYNITITKYFDALRFGNYDCIIFHSFLDIPKFLNYCPDARERLLLLVDDDFHTVRNNITADHLTMPNLMKIVMRIMERPKTISSNTAKRYYSGVMEDQWLQCLSMNKCFFDKDEEKVIKINSFCKRYNISGRVLDRVIETLNIIQVINTLWKVTYEIEIDEIFIELFRKKFPSIHETKRKVNILNHSTASQKTTNTILDDIKKAGIEYKITEEAIQLRVLKSFEDVDWDLIEAKVNEHVWSSIKDLDKSYLIYKNCCYGSIELTRRQKYLQRKNAFMKFHEFNVDPLSLNIINTFHKSNLLTSEIEEWVKHLDETYKDEHDLVLILQGVENARTARFKEDNIFGRYRRVRYEDLFVVVSKISKNKRVKIEQ